VVVLSGLQASLGNGTAAGGVDAAVALVVAGDGIVVGLEIRTRVELHSSIVETSGGHVGLLQSEQQTGLLGLRKVCNNNNNHERG
jgi:hypothetical protein